MPLQPPVWQDDDWTESILLYGANGSGKSRAWAAIRKWYEVTNTPGHFHIIDTESGMAKRTRAGYLNGELGNNFDSNATIYPVEDYDSLLDTSIKINENATGDDWIIVDSIGWGHLWARDKWLKGSKNVTWREFLDAGRSMKEVQPHQWSEPRGLYRDWLVPYVLQFPGHRLVVAHAKEIRMPTGDPAKDKWAEKKRQILETFGRYGVKPEGDDDLMYGFQVIMLTVRGRDTWTYTTVDDNEREFLDHQPVTDFVTSYLMPVADWVVT